MKIKNIVLSIFVSSLYWGYANAQSVNDAVTFSKDDNPASARIKGMGNVQTSLGGDITSINGNPAGLGFFSQSDISITFDYLQNGNKTDFLGTNSSSNKGKFGIGQVGVVFNFPNHNQIGDYAGWQNFNMGVSYNKKQDFNNSLIYNGINSATSYVNNLTDLMDADIDFRNDFYDSYLVEKFKDNSLGYFPLAEEFYDKDQLNDVLTKGSHSNTAIAIGGNYNNTFYIGATLGLSFFKYEKSKIFEENGFTKLAQDVAKDNPDSDFANPNSADYIKFGDKSYHLLDDYSQTNEGAGVDFKLGMIFKPATDWNIGLTLTTPTWLSISERTDAFTDVSFYPDINSTTSFHTYESDMYSSDQDYSLTTPWKFALGATKFFNRGLFSAEMEYLTYNTIRYNNPTRLNSYTEINNIIKDELKGALNVRLGGEYLLNNMISARAGFNYFGNPYQYADDSNMSGSAGLGFKLSNSIYMDLAVVHQVNSYSSSPYTLSQFWHDNGSYEPVADIKHNRTNAVLTLGAKF
ncbi:PorV/PorQ family protein [Sphingobacterium bovistauri]|uniref:Outer membrane protein transport protein (OMPP1/FadL/TodX) n=1 Tax=Sphingobacterium bovistauri TaxID=2781959 RepID=A0ABS7Z502_9SPHI|nr:hypothetical protein [Sphingobacterium bovistauri]MCA5005271.1 hypothetical protein [Sphingobacterium bovistauri]